MEDLKFIADAHLGKLAKYLRLCGFDTCYRTDLNDNGIIDLAITEMRTILTRDKEMLRNKNVRHGFRIRSQYPRTQLKEVFLNFDIKKPIALFSRCLECNGLLRQVTKEEVIGRLMPMTRRYFRKFKVCDECNRIYWNGSHYRNMKIEIRSILSRPTAEPDI